MKRSWTHLLPRCSAIVFDVGAAGLRAVQTVRRRGHIAVRDALAIELAEHGPEGETSPLDEVCARIARVVGQGAFSGREVALVLSPPRVHFHTLQMPPRLFEQPEDAVRQALAFEVAKETRTDARSLEVRHWPLPAGHRQSMNVMSASVCTADADAWVEGLAAHGLALKRLDLAPSALLELAGCGRSAPHDGVWGVLDLGCNSSHLAVAVGDVPVYVRSIAFSGRRLTAAIAGAFDIPLEQAEALKRRHGITPAPPDPAERRRDDAAIGPILGNMLRESIDTLIREVGMCFSYVTQNYVGRAVDRLVLAGGSARMLGLVEYMGEFFGIPVEAVNTGVFGHPALPIESAGALGGCIRDLEAA